MTDAEVEAVLALLDAGVALRVPFHTRLFPDATPQHNTLRRVGDAYELTTIYTEFAAGHGFRADLAEQEPRTREELKRALGWAKREDCSPSPGE